MKMLSIIFLFYSSYSFCIVISPPVINFKNNNNHFEIKLSNGADVDKAVFIEPEYISDSSFYLISNTDSLILPAKSFAKIQLKILGEFDEKREHLLYLNVTEMIKKPLNDNNTGYLSITNKLKVIITPRFFEKYKLSVEGGELVNAGPKYVQLMSINCDDNTELIDETLMEPFTSLPINENCNPTYYKESVLGRVRKISF